MSGGPLAGLPQLLPGTSRHSSIELLLTNLGGDEGLGGEARKEEEGRLLKWNPNAVFKAVATPAPANPSPAISHHSTQLKYQYLWFPKHTLLSCASLHTLATLILSNRETCHPQDSAQLPRPP